MEKDQIAPVLLVRPGQESNRLLELISENCCVKKKCGSEMCGGRQASTLSRLLRKRHPRTFWPLRSGIPENSKSRLAVCLNRQHKAMSLSEF